MRAIILAAGMGLRLVQPEGQQQPKCLRASDFPHEIAEGERDHDEAAGETALGAGRNIGVQLAKNLSSGSIVLHYQALNMLAMRSEVGALSHFSIVA